MKLLIYNHTDHEPPLDRFKELLKTTGLAIDIEVVRVPFHKIDFAQLVHKVSEKDGKTKTYIRPKKLWFDNHFLGGDFNVAWWTEKQYDPKGINDSGANYLQMSNRGEHRLVVSARSPEEGAEDLEHEFGHAIEYAFEKMGVNTDLSWKGKLISMTHYFDYHLNSLELFYTQVARLIEKHGNPFGLTPDEKKEMLDNILGGTNLAIHHTASTRASGNEQLFAVDKYHREERLYPKSSLGWNVGYNYFLDVSGKVTRTRRIGEETMAQKGHNCDVPSRCDTISVCLAGNFDMELPSDAQIASLRELIQDLRVVYPKLNITFHRALQKERTCPGKLFTQEYLDTRILQKNPPKEVVDLPTLNALEKVLTWLLANRHLLFK